MEIISQKVQKPLPSTHCKSLSFVTPTCTGQFQAKKSSTIYGHDGTIVYKLNLTLVSTTAAAEEETEHVPCQWWPGGCQLLPGLVGPGPLPLCGIHDWQHTLDLNYPVFDNSKGFLSRTCRGQHIQ